MTIRPDIAARIHIDRGDITTFAVDAIVNAANSSLLGGGGVDGAIHRAAGPSLLEECRTLGGCPIGEARITGGYQLPAKHIIHTVGPIYDRAGDEAADLLRCCYASCFDLARQHHLTSLAFPAISCGVYGYPMDEAAPIALDEAARQLENSGTIRAVHFVVFDKPARKVYEQLWAQLIHNEMLDS